MNYLEHTFYNLDSQETKELLLALLSEKGYSGFIEDEEKLIAYLPELLENEQGLNSLLDYLSCEDYRIEYNTSLISEQNWNAVWESEFQTIDIESKVLIRASFHKKDASYLYDLLIDPKMSFGTGHHETTRLMIQEMLQVDFQRKHVLDLGCGTGVLSILAAKMKAKSVLAVDIDEWAFKNSLENVQRNKCKQVEVKLGGLEVVPALTYDIILANINRNVLLECMMGFSSRMKKDGLLLISGIMEADLEILKTKAVDGGFNLTRLVSEKSWYSMTFLAK